MKYAVLTSNSFFSYLILSRLFDEFSRQIGVVIDARAVGKSKSTGATLLNVLRRSGFRGFCYKVGTVAHGRLVDQALRLIPGAKRRFSPFSRADQLGIPLATFADPNSEPCLAKLRSVEPDLIFAVNVYARLKPPLLQLPRIGVVNCHFGLLPNYRGMSPYMWALANNEREIGITVHFMDEDFDTGDIVDQKRIPIVARDSAYALYVRGCLAARTMLTDTVQAAERNAIPRASQPREGSYFSLPGPDCIRGIRRNGHRLVRLRDLAGTTLGKFGDERF